MSRISVYNHFPGPCPPRLELSSTGTIPFTPRSKKTAEGGGAAAMGGGVGVAHSCLVTTRSSNDITYT